jgi:ubiquinone/menaquinone biosynthesis C-methylase UbiE
VNDVEFSGLRGRFFAWFLTSPMRRILHKKMGNPDGRLLELLELAGHETVVDSGSGHHSLMVADRLSSGQVKCVDVSREMLERLSKLAAKRGLSHRIETVLADGLALPMADGSADRGLSVAVWHHLDDPQRACAELARVLRPGGRLVSIDLEIGPSKKPVRGLRGHDRRFGALEMEAILEEAGLTKISVETLGKWVIGRGDKPLE